METVLVQRHAIKICLKGLALKAVILAIVSRKRSVKRGSFESRANINSKEERKINKAPGGTDVFLFCTPLPLSPHPPPLLGNPQYTLSCSRLTLFSLSLSLFFQLIFLNEHPNNVIRLCKSAIFMQSKEQILCRLIREQRMQIQCL